jgi:hypothetical protein
MGPNSGLKGLTLLNYFFCVLTRTVACQSLPFIQIIKQYGNRKRNNKSSQFKIPRAVNVTFTQRVRNYYTVN